MDQIKEIPALNINNYNCVEADVSIISDLLQDSEMLKNADPAIERHMNIVNIGFFITSLLKAYRTE